MKMFTKFVVLVLAFGLIAAGISGCGGKDPGSIDVLDGPGMVYHSIGEYVTGGRTETDFGIIEIPQFFGLMPESDATKEANEAFSQIHDMLLSQIEDYKANGGQPEVGKDYSQNMLCSYRAEFCGDIVSVMLEYQDFYAPGYMYLSYNLNAEDGSRPVEPSVLIENCGVSEETIKNSIHYYGEKLMTQEWESNMLWTFANAFSPIDGIGDPTMGFQDTLDEMINKSLEDPLVYGDGDQLYIVAYYPSEAGADYYCKLVAVSDNTYEIDYLSPETPFGEEFKSAITEAGAYELIRKLLPDELASSEALRFKTDALMPVETEDGIYEPCYDIEVFTEEGGNTIAVARYGVNCYSATIFEYDPKGDAYFILPNGTGVIDCEPVTQAIDARALVAIYNDPDEYEIWGQPKVREIDLVYNESGEYYWMNPEAESMFAFATEEGKMFCADVTVGDDGVVIYGYGDRIGSTHVERGDAILVHAVRPEGKATQAIIFESEFRGKVVYLLQYNGENGNEKLELLEAE